MRATIETRPMLSGDLRLVHQGSTPPANRSPSGLTIVAKESEFRGQEDVDGNPGTRETWGRRDDIFARSHRLG
jgi:hypothetical protein